jgi:putative nucleotidyltransferase with HDIG domain
VLATLEYDGDYTFTFTHMVNVAILTMALADASGISGPLLREFGVAALLHDIGKVRTPPDILGKPGTLTEEEFAVMQRHTVDGAQILEATPDVPPLAAIVAFEHHLRLDGTGYPGVRQRSLSLATTLCSIVDVYDAMHSRRGYQPSFSTDRIFAVLQGNDGRRFDQMLVRRFGELVNTAS